MSSQDYAFQIPVWITSLFSNFVFLWRWKKGKHSGKHSYKHIMLTCIAAMEYIVQYYEYLLYYDIFLAATDVISCSYTSWCDKHRDNILHVTSVPPYSIFLISGHKKKETSKAPPPLRHFLSPFPLICYALLLLQLLLSADVKAPLMDY